MTKDTLILEQDGIFKRKMVFSRTEERIEPIERIQLITEKYASGKLKSSGIKENGFGTGVWTEWFENGNVKSIVYYDVLLPLMIVKFDSEGNLISKHWFDFNSKSYRTE